MTDTYRRERIERILKELEYEVTRGIMEREIEEEMGFEFIVKVSRHFKNGGVMCSFRTRPVPDVRYLMNPGEPRLRVVTPPDSKDGTNKG